MAVFFCGPTCVTHYCGQSNHGFDASNTISWRGEQWVREGPTFAIVLKACSDGGYVFGHEVSHLFGCDHNREQVNPANPDAPLGYQYGYLMRPPVNSGYITIMASVLLMFRLISNLRL